MSGEQGHYEATLTRQGGRPLRRTFPFGQWAEIGYWLDEVGANEQDELAVRFHRLVAPTAEARWVAILDSGIEELELGVRAYNCCKRQGIDTCAQVLNLDLGELDAWDAAHEKDVHYRWGRQAREQIREAQVGLQSLRLQLQAEIEAEQRGEGVRLDVPFECSVDESAGQRGCSGHHHGRSTPYRIGPGGHPVCVYCGEELEL